MQVLRLQAWQQVPLPEQSARPIFLTFEDLGTLGFQVCLVFYMGSGEQVRVHFIPCVISPVPEKVLNIHLNLKTD